MKTARTKIKSKNLLPKNINEITNGGVYLQMVRCGKENCRCARGDLHEGYYYFIRRESGKMVKSYVPKARVKEFISIIDSFRAERGRRRKIDQLARSMLREMKCRLLAQGPLTKTGGNQLTND